MNWRQHLRSWAIAVACLAAIDFAMVAALVLATRLGG